MATSLPTSQIARKIYFAGSISGGTKDERERERKVYGKIIPPLENYGTVLTKHVASPTLDNQGKC